MNREAIADDSEVVLLIKVLPAGVNEGYEDFINSRILRVNGEPVRDLRHLKQIVESCRTSRFITFVTEDGHTLALDRRRVEQEQGIILETYRISSAMSPGLRTASAPAGYLPRETGGGADVSVSVMPDRIEPAVHRTP